MVPEHILLWEGDQTPTIIEATAVAAVEPSPEHCMSLDGVDMDVYVDRRQCDMLNARARYTQMTAERVSAHQDLEPRLSGKKSGNVHFALEGDWRQHQQALTPLGLAALLTSTCYAAGQRV